MPLLKSALAELEQRQPAAHTESIGDTAAPGVGKGLENDIRRGLNFVSLLAKSRQHASLPVNQRWPSTSYSSWYRIQELSPADRLFPASS